MKNLGLISILCVLLCVSVVMAGEVVTESTISNPAGGSTAMRYVQDPTSVSDLQISAYDTDTNKLFQYRLTLAEAEQYPIGTWFPTPAGCPFQTKISALPVLSAKYSGAVDLVPRGGGWYLRMGEDSSALNRAVMEKMEISPAVNAYRPAVDCDAPSAAPPVEQPVAG